MHREILSSKQIKLLPLLKKFSKDFGLVGGTAIALHIGHRGSIDFDLFTGKSFRNSDIKRKIIVCGKIERVLVDKKDEYTIVVDGIKTTFLFYDFPIGFNEKLGDFIKMPDLLTLAAMKAYALGRRAKWKDYVDLYFIMKEYHTFAQICARAKKIFGAEFNEKIFRVQLSYFKDIDYSETVDFLKGFKVSDAVIKRRLKEFSVGKG